MLTFVLFCLLSVSQTVSPSVDGALTDIWDLSYQNAFNRNFTVLKKLTLKSVSVYRVAWNNGCGGSGSTKLEIIDVFKMGFCLIQKRLMLHAVNLKKLT